MPPLGTSPRPYRIRATYSDGANTAVDLSNSPFRIVSSATSYYVNDVTLAGGLYTTAPGNDDNSGKSPDKPMASLQALLDLYDLDAGDTVYVDAGTYTLPVNLVFGANDSGVAIVGAGRDSRSSTAPTRPPIPSSSRSPTAPATSASRRCP
jgi:hypothetical protein